MFQRGGKHEQDKIQDRLRPGEEVMHVITQKHLMKPSTYFITNQRMIIRDPSLFGSSVQSLLWNDVGDVEISKGPLRATISFHRGSGGLEQSMVSSGRLWKTMGRGAGSNVFSLTDIGKSEAEKVFALLEELISTAKKKKLQATQHPQNPLDLLKTKFINGEITAEEYEEKKKTLEG